MTRMTRLRSTRRRRTREKMMKTVSKMCSVRHTIHGILLINDSPVLRDEG